MTRRCVAPIVGVICAALSQFGSAQPAFPKKVERLANDGAEAGRATTGGDEDRVQPRLKLDTTLAGGVRRNPPMATNEPIRGAPTLRLSRLLSGAETTTPVVPNAANATGIAIYSDRIIDGGTLPPLNDDASDFFYNADGQPRSWRVEGFANDINSGGISRRENGFSFGGRYETRDYGALSIDGSVRNGLDSGLLTVRQRGLAFDDDWRANNGLGMLNTSAIELSRNQYRFYLPTFPIVGLQSEWLHNGDLQIQASVGEPGAFNGVRLSGFSRLGGRIFTGGAQWVSAPQWLTGFQFVDTQGVGGGLYSADTNAKFSAQSWYGSTAWRDDNTRLQFNLVDSTNGPGAHRQGAWLDGETRDGRYRHNYGAFRLDPGIVWGYLPFIDDSLGGYYRLAYQSQQLLWTAGVDSVTSISGRGVNGLYSNASIRYQVSRSVGVGGGANARHAQNNAEAAYAFFDKRSELGTTRLQFDAASASGGQRSQKITLDQSWPTEVGMRFSSSLSLDRETAPNRELSSTNIGIVGGIDLSNNLAIEGNIQWQSARDKMSSIGNSNATSIGTTGNTSRGLYANVSLNWRISSRWSLSMTYYDNRREQQLALSAASLLPTQLITPVVKDRATFLILRYENRAGTQTAPLGGAPGSGAGDIVGYLFLDENNNDRREGNEVGAANVSVLLDGRFSTRTDHQGRFEFSQVAVGTHSISIIADNLPLPYFVGGDEKRAVVVRTRETTTLNVPASKRK